MQVLRQATAAAEVSMVVYEVDCIPTIFKKNIWNCFEILNLTDMEPEELRNEAKDTLYFQKCLVLHEIRAAIIRNTKEKFVSF